MENLEDTRNAFLEKLISLDNHNKIIWDCDRRNSTISCSIQHITITISEKPSGMGLKAYGIEIFGNDSEILEKFDPDRGFSFDESPIEELFGTDGHTTNKEIGPLYRNAMKRFFKKNLTEIIHYMDNV